jgi:hypothetical protein
LALVDHAKVRSGSTDFVYGLEVVGHYYCADKLETVEMIYVDLHTPSVDIAEAAETIP